MYYKNVRIKSVWVIAFLVLVGLILNAQTMETSTQNIEPPFNVKEVIEKVSHQTNEKYCISSPLKGEENACPEPSRRGEGNYSRDGEFLIDTSVVYVPAVVDPDSPAVAFDGTNYLVVWVRSGHIYATRVSQSGIILDPLGFAISMDATEDNPQVAFDGTNYLVVWQYSPWGTPDYYIYGARVSQSGTVLDPGGFAISITDDYKDHPVLAFDGMNYLIVWEAHALSQYADIYGARVSPSGIVLDSAGIAISTAAWKQLHPAVAFDGSNYLVVWQDHRDEYYSSDIYGARVSQAGVILDSNGIAISTVQYSQCCPSIAFDGTSYLVVWQDSRSNSSWDIYGARVSQSGMVLDPNGIAIATTCNYSAQYTPAVAFDGTDYLVVWEEVRVGSSINICGARVTQSGAVLDSAGIVITSASWDQEGPAVAFGDTNYLVVWQKWIGNPSSSVGPYLHGARVSESGIVLDSNGIPIATEVNRQTESAVAFDGTNYLVVYTDNRCGVDDIYGARVSQSGTVLDSCAFMISTKGGYYADCIPDVAFDDTNYLAVWMSGDVYGARISQTGTVLDTDAIRISTTVNMGYDGPAVAFGDSNYLVVWETGPDVYCTRVSRSGTVLDPEGIRISRADFCQQWPSVAFDGTNYLVVWVYPTSVFTAFIYGARVSQSGVVLDPYGINISYVPNCGCFCPSVAFDGTNYLVVWNDDRYGCIDVFGARVAKSGAVLDPSGIGIIGALTPTVAFDGTCYLVVSQDPGVYGARVSPTGAFIDWFMISEMSLNPLSIDVAHGQGNQFLITFSGWTDSINTHPANTMLIWGDFYYNTGIEEARNQKQETRFSVNVCPNPCRSVSTISFTIPSATIVNLSLYDVSGRLVTQLVDAKLEPGTHTAFLDASTLASGVYIYRLETDEFTTARKMVLMK